MVYMTYWFLFFAVVSLVLFWISPKGKLRKYFLLLSCVIFHGHFAGPAGVVPIIIMGLVTYFCSKSRNSSIINFAIIFNVLGLVYYKYTHFLIGNVISNLNTSWSESLDLILKSKSISAPLAISFFTFEFVHYLYDVKKGEESIKNFFDFTLFAIFWPSIVAGPVKRYQQFLPQLKNSLLLKYEDIHFFNGMFRIVSGILKKILADNITAFILYSQNNDVFNNFSMPMRWVFFVLLALRIYFDFSGYSDLAIGYARLMGIQLPENFNWPYLATNIGDFWRRWHISLSSWIRDYIYIPLGGSKNGNTRKAFNGLLAFFICGLWHGSAWNFAFWGTYHGAGLAISNYYKHVPVIKKLELFFVKVPIMAWFLNFMFVCVGWLYFFYPIGQANDFMLKLFVR